MIRNDIIYGMGSFIAIILFWQLSVSIFNLNETLYPPPADVLLALMDANELFTDIGVSLLRLILGSSFGVIIGVSCGVLTGRSHVLNETFGQVANFSRYIPPLALVPIFLIWFGIGELSKISLLFWTAFFPVWISTHTGVRSIGRKYILVARSLGVKSSFFIKDVLLKGSLTYILSGTRIGIGFAFSVLVAAEMLGAYSGLGHRISIFQSVYRIDMMIGYIIVLGFLGFAIDRILLLISRKLTPWRTHET